MRLRSLPAVATAVLLLAACAPAGGGGTRPPSTPSASPSVRPCNSPSQPTSTVTLMGGIKPKPQPPTPTPPIQPAFQSLEEAKAAYEPMFAELVPLMTRDVVGYPVTWAKPAAVSAAEVHCACTAVVRQEGSGATSEHRDSVAGVAGVTEPVIQRYGFTDPQSFVDAPMRYREVNAKGPKGTYFTFELGGTPRLQVIARVPDSLCRAR